MRPLENLANAFDQIGNGDYRRRVPEDGPPETPRRLASGFNTMTHRLATVAAQNRRLHERLLTLQAEERADLARDLHDEIGPLLFAVDMTAATIERRRGRRTEPWHVPMHVRVNSGCGCSNATPCSSVLLGRLRPIGGGGTDGRHRSAGGILAEAAVPISRSGSLLSRSRWTKPTRGSRRDRCTACSCRRGMSNAIRHGKPTRVDISIAATTTRGIRVEVSG